MILYKAGRNTRIKLVHTKDNIFQLSSNDTIKRLKYDEIDIEKKLIVIKDIP